MNGKWNRNIPRIIEKIDECIREGSDEALTLRRLAEQLGYSEYHFSRMFRQVSGMRLREYLRYRRLAFALAPVRDTRDSFLKIALDYGFSSHEAFTRAFRQAYGLTPREYRQNPAPVALHTILRPFDCYLLEKGRAEGAEGGYTGRVPPGMQLLEVPEGEYSVFEHGPFDPEKENALVEERMETAMREFDYKASGYRLDTSPGRIFYFYHDPQRYWKYIRPVKREGPGD